MQFKHTSRAIHTTLIVFVFVLSPKLYKTIILVVVGVFGRSKRQTKENFNEKKIKEEIRNKDREEILQKQRQHD